MKKWIGKIVRVRNVLSQHFTHLDSYGSRYLFEREGQKSYPGCDTANTVLWGTGTHCPDGKTFRDYLKEGTLPIGVCGSPFDEHPSTEFGDRKALGESAMSLTAKELGVHNHSSYRRLIKLVTEGDLAPVKDPINLGVVVKHLHRNGWTSEEVREWVYVALDAIVAYEAQCFAAETTRLAAKKLCADSHPLYRRLTKLVAEGEAKPEENLLNLGVVVKLLHNQGWTSQQVTEWLFPALDAIVATQTRFNDAVKQLRQTGFAQIHEIVIAGEKRDLLFVRSNNDQMNAAVRHLGKDKFGVLIQQRDTGHVQIFSNHSLGITLCDVASKVRDLELRLSGEEGTQDASDYADTLKDPGQLPILPKWCYQMPGEALLNGSESAPGLEPTALAPVKLVELVRTNVRVRTEEETALLKPGKDDANDSAEASASVEEVATPPATADATTPSGAGQIEVAA